MHGDVRRGEGGEETSPMMRQCVAEMVARGKSGQGSGRVRGARII